MLKYSIGELIDKLAVIHLKIWHIEEKIAEFPEEDFEPTKEQVDLLDQVVSLNKLRVEIVDSINELFEELKNG
jgi:hypothetical protein